MITADILILDFGSQYTQLIARKIRELSVSSLIVPHDISIAELQNYQPKGLILSGGPESVYHENALHPDLKIFSMGLPILGICYGLQYIVHHFGGKVAGGGSREYGKQIITILNTNILFADIKETTLQTWMSHGDSVVHLPEGFEILAKTQSGVMAAIACEARHLYGLQFHAEVAHTSQGQDILKRFVFDIACAEPNWQIADIKTRLVADIRTQVQGAHVILGLSGGVDSSVVACLLHEAIGDQLTCIFVDTGLLRLDEGDQLMQLFQEKLHVNVVRINARDKFLSALKDVEDPEQKRKIIGKLFIEVFEIEAKKIKNATWLAQGTIYPDVIESAGGSSTAHLIKSHHNVGGLPEKMHLKLLEPLRLLFKDEVRKLGATLGLPEFFLNRHPFPGPGLAVRILGKIEPEYIEILQKADDIFIKALYNANLYHTLSQAFAVFLPVKSVGVQGDGRVYEWVVALRAVETQDFMTANAARISLEFLSDVAREIINKVKGISRVVYDISDKPPATIEWE